MSTHQSPIKKRRWTDEEVKILHKKYYTTSTFELSELLDRTRKSIWHKARREDLRKHPQMQLINLIREIETPEFEEEKFNNFIAGFVAGEGSFHTASDTPIFSIVLTESDRQILEDIRDYFGKPGSIYEQGRKNTNAKPEVHFVIKSEAENWMITVPFFDRVGLRSTNKQNQYQNWREELEKKIPKKIDGIPRW